MRKAIPKVGKRACLRHRRHKSLCRQGSPLERVEGTRAAREVSTQHLVVCKTAMSDSPRPDVSTTVA